MQKKEKKNKQIGLPIAELFFSILAMAILSLYHDSFYPPGAFTITLIENVEYLSFKWVDFKYLHLLGFALYFSCKTV